MLKKTMALLLLVVVLAGAECGININPDPRPNPDPPAPTPAPTPAPNPAPAPGPNPAPTPFPNPAPNPAPNPNPAPGPAPYPAPNPAPTIAGDELAFIEAMAIGARTARGEADTHAFLAVFYLLAASNQAGNWVATGTLQLDADLSVVGYSPQPADRLVVTGPTSHFEYIYYAINGDLSGATAFSNNHSDLRFRVVAANMDIQVASARNYGDFQRRCLGSITLPRGVAQVDVTEGGGDHADVSVHGHWGGYWDVGGTSSITGTVTAAGGTIQVAEAFDTRIVNTVLQSKVGISSTGIRAGAQYVMRDAYFQYVERSGHVTEIDYWRVQGGLERDGAAIGTCGFDGPVVFDFFSPGRVLNLVDGTEIGI